MKKLLTGTLAAVLSVSLCTPAVYAKDNVETKTLKKSNSGNPMLGFDENGDILYGGDPSVLVDGDTVYCYVGHDTSSNESYWMPDWRCYSSKDMKNWTYESKIMNSSDIKGVITTRHGQDRWQKVLMESTTSIIIHSFQMEKESESVFRTVRQVRLKM